MTYGNNIIGVNKLLRLVPNFKWNKIDMLMDFKFWIGFNELYDETSFLEATFRFQYEDANIYYVNMQFEDIESLNLQYISKINQIMGFEIVDKSKDGCQMRYFVNDYENSLISFYCNRIKVIDICKGSL